MERKLAKGVLSGLAAILWMCTVANADVVDNAVFPIRGVRWDGTNYVRTQIGGIWVYTVVTGYTRDHRDGDTLLAGHETRTYEPADNCGVAAHKPGGNQMRHAHVVDSADFPTQSFQTGMLVVTKDECTKYWSVRIYSEGNDGYANIPYPITDGADSKVEWGAPSYHYNCYGFAFDNTISKYKLMIGDGASGAQKVLDAEFNQQEDWWNNRLGTVMHMSGSHANYVNAVWEDCDNYVASLQFKYAEGQCFTFSYNYPGRAYNRAWMGTTPTYWQPK